MTFVHWLLSIGVEGAVVCGVGVIAYLALRNRSASWQHVVLTCTVLGLLVIPLIALVPPSFQLRVPGILSETSESSPDELIGRSDHRPYQVPSAGDDVAKAIATSQAVHETHTPTETGVSESAAEFVAETSADSESQRVSIGPGDATGDSAEVASAVNEVTTALAVRDRVAVALVVTWTFGALVVAMLPLLGLLGVRRARRTSQPVEDSGWHALLDDLRQECSVRRSVELRMSNTVETAITWGVFRPVILLPMKSSQWSDSKRSIVLRHELAHIGRHDWLTQMLALLCCSLHWFNPMVWWINRQMQIVREQACDDLVLLSGTEHTRYAETLLEMAQHFRRRTSLAVVPMAQQSRLEKRMRAILDTKRCRESASRGMVAVTIALCGLLLIPLAMVGAAGGSPPANEDSNESVAVANPTGEAPAESDGDAANEDTSEPIPSRNAGSSMERVRIVSGVDGKPVAGASVTYDPKVNPAIHAADTLIAVAVSDEHGEVALPKDTLDYLKFRIAHPAFLRGEFARTGAMIPGWTLYRSEWPYGRDGQQKIVKLWPGETIAGVVRHQDGKPASGFEFQLVSPETDFAWYRSIVEPRVAKALGPEESRVALEWRCFVKTNKDGRYSVAAPPRSRRKELRALGNSDDVAPFYQLVEIGATDITLERGAIVRGTYRNLDGTPAAKTSITLSRVFPSGEQATAERHRIATTDDDGRFEFAPAASGPHLLRPYQGTPQRLELQSGETMEVDADVAPYHNVTFEFENTMGHLSGNFNFWIRGDIETKGGGDPIEVAAVPFHHGNKITFRVDQSMKNAKLHFNNWPTQSVRIVEQSGNVIMPSEDSKPIQLPDLRNPPKLKICMGKAARFYVDVREADGALAKDIEVTGEAVGDYGKRRIGSFHRSGDVWERGGLFEGERVTVTVRRGNWSVTSKPSDPVKVKDGDPTNKIKLQLPSMTVTAAKPRDGVFFGYTGFMTYVIELKNGRFRYWFESDAKSISEPTYPLTGKYTVVGDTLTLHHDKLIPLTSIWKYRSVNGLTTLWRRDALEQHAQKPIKLSVENLRRWGGGSILAFTTNPAEQMWMQRTAPTLVAPPAEENSDTGHSSLRIEKPGNYEFANVSISVRSTKDSDGLVRNELILSHGEADARVEDRCALAFGEGSWALLIKAVKDKPGCLWTSVVDQYGVHTYEFDPVAKRARFSKPGFDAEARWSTPAKRFLDGNLAQFADREVVTWATDVLPRLKPEPEEANLPRLEVRLVAEADETPEMVRPTVARRTVNYRRLGTFVPLGERILQQDELVVMGISTSGVVRTLYGIQSEEAAARFEAFSEKNAGRRVAFVKDGQVVNQATLDADFSQSRFLSSKL